MNSTPRAAQFDFPQSSRIKRAIEFTGAIRVGKHAADDMLVCNAIPNSHGISRVGISIPKKTGNAVVRNRWKRWLREAFRTQRHLIPEGFDFVVRPRRGADGDWGRISRSLVIVTRRSAAKYKPKSKSKTNVNPRTNRQTSGRGASPGANHSNKKQTP